MSYDKHINRARENLKGYSDKDVKGIHKQMNADKKKAIASKMSEARKGYNAQRKADQLKPKRGGFKIV